MKPTPEQIEQAAAAIANARGGRRGMPPISNVLEMLPANLVEEVTEDARAALEAVEVESDDEHDAELGRWQEAIRELLIKASGAPADAIDGSGCDSGDPLDLTLTEISAALRYARGER